MSARHLRRVPGFRSGQRWRQLFAIVAYGLAVLFIGDAVLGGIDAPHRKAPTDFQNGGFEEGDAGWNLATQTSIDMTPSDAHSGRSSLRLVATEPWQFTYQTIAVKAGQPYDLEAWGRSKSSGGLISLITYDASGNEMGPHFDRAISGTGDWVVAAGVYVPPAGAVRASLLLQSSAPGTYWFDDISLVVGANLLENPGFELGVTSWNLSNDATIDSVPADAHSGGHSLKLVAYRPWQGSFQSVTLIPGQYYAFSGWGRSTAAGGHLTLVGLDANGAEAGSHFDLIFNGTGSWTFVAGKYFAPVNAISANVELQSSGPGTFWFDDITLVPNANLVDNAGFEEGAQRWVLSPQATIDLNPANSHTGASSLKLRADAPWEGAHQSIPVVQGQAYALKGWGRSGTDGGHLTLVSFGSNGAEVGSHFDLTFPGTGHWVSYIGTYKAPSAAVRVDLFVQSSRHGEFWFDDISMTRR